MGDSSSGVVAIVVGGEEKVGVTVTVTGGSESPGVVLEYPFDGITGE